MSTPSKPIKRIETGNTKAAIAAAGGKSADLWMMPPDKIHYDPADNVRPLNAERVEHLGGLILEHGYDKGSPLSCYVRKVDGQDMVYVWRGQHRYHGALWAMERGREIDKIPCVILEAKSVSRRNLTILGVIDNDHERMSLIDLAYAAVILQDEGMTNAEIARVFTVTDQTIRDALLLLKAPEPVRTAIDKGAVSASTVIKEVRKHGPKAAADRVQHAVDAATAQGKTKATAKHFDPEPPSAPTVATPRERPEDQPAAQVQSREKPANAIKTPSRSTRLTEALRIDAAPAPLLSDTTLTPHTAYLLKLLRDVHADEGYYELQPLLRDRVDAALSVVFPSPPASAKRGKS